MRILFCLVLFCLATFHSNAQTPYTYQLTDEDGLPGMEVYNIMQDKRGFIWIGTDNGICKYDGKTFKTYYHPAQKGKAFSFIFEDSFNRTWCINFSGQIFYVQNDTLVLYKPFENIVKNGFPRITITPDQMLWIVMDNFGVYYIDLHTLKLSKAKFSDGYHYSNAISVDKNKALIHSSNKSSLVTKDGIIKSFFTNQKGVTFSKYLNSIFWFGIAENVTSIFQYDLKKQKYHQLKTTQLNLKTAMINDFISFAADDNWLLTTDGIYIVSIKDDLVSPELFFLNGVNASWVIKDDEGNYWIGTLKNGIYVLPTKKIWVANEQNKSLPFNRINRIQEDNNGLLWLAGAKGALSVLNPQINRITKTIYPTKINRDIELLYFDKYSDQLYLFHQSNKLHVYHTITQKCSVINESVSAVKDIKVDPHGNLIINNSYFGFIILKNPKAKHKINFTSTFLPDSSALVDNRIWLRRQRGYSNIYIEQDTAIIMGFTDGLYEFKRDKQKEIKFNGSSIYATWLANDPDGSIWIATVQQGLFHYKSGEIIKQFNTKYGLHSDYVKCVEVTNDMVWIATENGIQGLDKNSGNLIAFTKEKGLITNDVLDLHAKDNFLYIATSKGLQWFDVKSIPKNTIPPRVYINLIKSANAMYVSKTPFVLPYEQNKLDIWYSGIGYKSRGKLTYKYQLNKSDTTWYIAQSSDNVLRLSSLAPGDYQLKLYAINEDGVMSGEPAVAFFSVAFPYYQSWWFVLFLALILIGIVSLIFYIRIKIISRRNKLERDKVMLEIALRTSQLSALKVQMNPHFIFNALNSIQEYIITNNKKLANSYLGKFSDLMRSYLDMSNRTSISLEEELKAMKLYLELETMRFEEQFTFELDINEQLIPDEIAIPAMIIQPYVENAIKHGLLHKRTDKKLKITFHPGEKQTLICTVSDNGIGRKQSANLNALRNKKHQSFATGATQKRLELLNAGRQMAIGVVYHDLLNPDGSAAGTTVVITIPWE